MKSVADRPLALGRMRLSTERDRDEAAAIDVLHAAFDAGITLLDSAAAYSWDDDESGHNERLIARALAAWKGSRSTIVVATKGGMTRPGGQWVVLIRRHRLDPAACIYVGDGSQDEGFARRFGFQYRQARDFFGDIEALT